MSTLDTCDCFDHELVQGGTLHRPGLARLGERQGVHGKVLARLLAELDRAVRRGAEADPSRPGPLSGLKTRELDDPAVALLDAFAVVADVLTFYSDRITNEGYLRTAEERRSLLELARLIGYELRPGVAAHAWLTFEVEENAPRPAGNSEPPASLVPARTKVQSVPGQDELPQTFETSADLLARAECNKLRPQLFAPAQLDPNQTTIELAGTETGLRSGDFLLLVGGTGEGPVVGAPTLRRITRVVPDAARSRTRVDFGERPAAPTAAIATTQLQANVDLEPLPFAKSAVEAVLARRYTDIGLSSLLRISRWPRSALVRYAAAEHPPADLPPAAPGVYAFRARAGVFGHNAPRVNDALTKDGWSDWDANSNVNVTTNSNGDVRHPLGLDLEAEFTAVLPGSWVVLRAGGQSKVCRVATAESQSRADFALSAKVTRLTLTEAGGTAAQGLSQFKPRTTTVFAESERLELAPVPITETLGPGATELTLDALVLDLAVGKPIAISGEDAEVSGARWVEVRSLTAVTHAAGRTTLEFEPLAHSYKRSSVEVNANVVEATHGESVEAEPLGSGNGRAHQRFGLARRPATYVSAANPEGAAATLEVRVDGVRWDEARALVGLGAAEERYVVRRDDDGRTEVVFGDGVQGARPPTGFENVVARYRVGIGAPGMVGASALTVMQTRPLGVRSVTNPLAAAGGEDPESRDSARENAPLTVMTLDRVVSLGDYENFARAFAGIGKARADALWRRGRMTVHLTVAGPKAVDVDDVTRGKLIEALRRAGDPGVDLRIGGFRPLPFAVLVTVLVDERQEASAVIERVRETLRSRFSFEAQDFGAPVSESDLISASAAVDGVLDVTVAEMHRVGGSETSDTTKQDPLLARAARWAAAAEGEVEPAELLYLSPLGTDVRQRGA